MYAFKKETLKVIHVRLTLSYNRSTVVFEYWADGEPNGDSGANQACVDMSGEEFLV